MSHNHASPALDRFLESVVRQLPRETIEAMAYLRPPFDEHVDDAVADEVIHLFQAKAKAARMQAAFEAGELDFAPARPLAMPEQRGPR